MRHFASARYSQRFPDHGVPSLHAPIGCELRSVAAIERADTEMCSYERPAIPSERDLGERETCLEAITQVGPYRIVKLIGAGSMGNVYEAEHVLLGRRVAIKILREELAGSRAFVQRLFAEARASNLVGDEHIVEVFDLACEPNGMPWFAMELLAGRSLAELCVEHELSVERALDLALQVCQALVLVHEAGIVHRDIKPENIFVVNRDGRDFVKLLDFGIARFPDAETPPATRGTVEAVLGTPPYMAPEQVVGGPIDARTDLYAVGALLFELLTGSMLFRRASTAELLSAVVLAEPSVPSEHVSLPDAVRAQVDSVVRRCLAKEAADRPASARDLAGELATIAFCLQEADEHASSASVTAALPALELELPSFDERESIAPASVLMHARRAPVWAACAAAISTWLAPELASWNVPPAFDAIGSWLTTLTESSTRLSSAHTEAAVNPSVRDVASQEAM